MTTNVMVARKFMLGLCSQQFEDFSNSPQNRKQREKTISGKKKVAFLFLATYTTHLAKLQGI